MSFNLSQRRSHISESLSLSLTQLLSFSLQDPSRPGEMRDCSNCLFGAHLRKFIIEGNRLPFASFGGTDEVCLKSNSNSIIFLFCQIVKFLSLWKRNLLFVSTRLVKLKSSNGARIFSKLRKNPKKVIYVSTWFVWHHKTLLWLKNETSSLTKQIWRFWLLHLSFFSKKDTLLLNSSTFAVLRFWLDDISFFHV